MVERKFEGRVDSGLDWEQKYGYCRARRVGDRILVSGTTASRGDGSAVAPGDAGAQARFVIERIERALHELGSGLDDVVRTRIYVAPGADWEAVATAHGERFGAVRPANTLVHCELVGEGHLVEIEAEAVVGAGGSP